MRRQDRREDEKTRKKKIIVRCLITTHSGTFIPRSSSAPSISSILSLHFSSSQYNSVQLCLFYFNPALYWLLLAVSSFYFISHFSTMISSTSLSYTSFSLNTFLPPFPPLILSYPAPLFPLPSSLFSLSSSNFLSLAYLYFL